MSIKCEPNIIFNPDDNPIGRGGDVLNKDFVGIKEFESDFSTIVSSLENVSLDLRPDAISCDYKTAFTLGPIAQGNISAGPVSFVWRVRVDNTAQKVYLARALDSTWDAEVELFTFVGAPVDEIDAAFDQNSNVVICAERAGNVWLYWFKPSLLAFAFENFNVGRTPRLILDSPLDVANSDVLLFYINDATNNFCYRQQRDLYANELNVVTDPAFDTVSNKYLEDVVKREDSRVVIIYSTHDLVTGKYTLNEIQSALYPYIMDVEAQFVRLSLLQLLLILALVDYTVFDIDTQNTALALQNVLLETAISTITYIAFDIDSQNVITTLQNLLLDTILLSYTAFDVDSQNVSLALQAVALVIALVAYTTFDIDSQNVNLSLQSLTLV